MSNEVKKLSRIIENFPLRFAFSLLAPCLGAIKPVREIARKGICIAYESFLKLLFRQLHHIITEYISYCLDVKFILLSVNYYDSIIFHSAGK